MTAKRLTQLLVEETGRVDPRIRVLLNRALLQIHNAPSLEAFLVDATVVGRADGSAVLQFDFLRLPREVISEVERLLSARAFRKKRWSRFIRDGQAHLGLELLAHPDDLPDDAYAYAY